MIYLCLFQTRQRTSDDVVEYITYILVFEGPNKSSIDDFWRMVWQEDVRTIVMLTNLTEDAKVCLRKRSLSSLRSVYVFNTALIDNSVL